MGGLSLTDEEKRATLNMSTIVRISHILQGGQADDEPGIE
jgi:hypothetical protein